MTDIFSSLLTPFFGFLQNFLDVSFTILSFFGFSAPNVTDLVNGLLGVAA